MSRMSAFPNSTTISLRELQVIPNEKETLMKRLWPDAFDDEANLANNSSLLRKVLGDSANMIETVPRRGYRFVGEVREQGDGMTTSSSSSIPPAACSKRRPGLCG
jgi:DNA-binding winged helix-turn-helix (wHTH) protein